LIDLLDNSSKNIDEARHIEVFVELEGSHALVKVDDGGVDIKPPGPSRLFDVFGQATHSIERAPDSLEKVFLGQPPDRNAWWVDGCKERARSVR
jgi:hypothetical protein